MISKNNVNLLSNYSPWLRLRPQILLLGIPYLPLPSSNLLSTIGSYFQDLSCTKGILLNGAGLDEGSSSSFTTDSYRLAVVEI